MARRGDRGHRCGAERWKVSPLGHTSFLRFWVVLFFLACLTAYMFFFSFASRCVAFLQDTPLPGAAYLFDPALLRLCIARRRFDGTCIMGWHGMGGCMAGCMVGRRACCLSSIYLYIYTSHQLEYRCISLDRIGSAFFVTGHWCWEGRGRRCLLHLELARFCAVRGEEMALCCVLGVRGEGVSRLLCLAVSFPCATATCDSTTQHSLSSTQTLHNDTGH